MPAAKKLSNKQLLEQARQLQLFFELGYVNKKQLLLISFYKGIATGFGALLGGTIVVGLLIWILSLFGQVPLVGHFVEVVNHTVQNK
ncbi:MAG: DUF5665 domain-containing protein [Candidatus Saccharimonadales bacterium]